MRYLEGRTNRVTYCASLAVLAALTIAIALVTGKHGTVGELVVATICVPRLHDIGRSWVWVLPPLVLEGIVLLNLFGGAPLEKVQIALGIIVLASAALVICLGLIPGQRQANRFGEPPAPGLSFGPAGAET